MHIRRALLFMPGDDRRKCEKGATLDADSVIMDLEDAVTAANKTAARDTVRDVLQSVSFGRTERLVRINPVQGPLWEDDLRETADALPDGYVIPKVESADQVRRVSQWLAAAEDRHGLARNSIHLLALVETTMGVVNLREIASADARLDALIFGAEDLAGDMGATRTEAGWEVHYARSAVVLHARAFGLQAIDTVYVKLDDAVGLAQDTETARIMGYTGKLAIHPRQVEPIQRAFTPSREEIDSAQRLINYYRQQESAGAGVFDFEGKMVDMPMIRAAEHVLGRARAAGLLDDR